MSVPHTILANLPSLCQKLSDLVEVCRSYNKNNFACFLRHGVHQQNLILFLTVYCIAHINYKNCLDIV